jgi:hypothetical protein
MGWERASERRADEPSIVPAAAAALAGRARPSAGGVAAGAGPPCPACASPSLPFLLSLLPTSPSPTLFFPPSSPSLSSRPSCRVESFLTWCGPYRPMRRLSPPARRLTRADLPLPPSNRRSSSSEVRLCLLRKLSCPSRLGYPTSWLARQDAPVPGRTLVRLLTMLPAPLTSASSFAPSAEGTDTSQGTPQLLSNISSCLAVANVVATTLGPRGMDKLIVDANVRSLTLFLTSRAAGFITRAGAAERVDETGRRVLAAGGVPGLPGARLNRGDNSSLLRTSSSPPERGKRVVSSIVGGPEALEGDPVPASDILERAHKKTTSSPHGMALRLRPQRLRDSLDCRVIAADVRCSC